MCTRTPSHTNSYCQTCTSFLPHLHAHVHTFTQTDKLTDTDKLIRGHRLKEIFTDTCADTHHRHTDAHIHRRTDRPGHFVASHCQVSIFVGSLVVTASECETSFRRRTETLRYFVTTVKWVRRCRKPYRRVISASISSSRHFCDPVFDASPVFHLVARGSAPVSRPVSPTPRSRGHARIPVVKPDR